MHKANNFIKIILLDDQFNFIWISIRSRFYGLNSIEVEVKSYLRLLFEEILNPFYIFQIFACILWMNDQYYYYASCIIIISFISMTVSLVETKRVRYAFNTEAMLVKINVSIVIASSNITRHGSNASDSYCLPSTRG